MRDFFVHNALYWLEEYAVDGLRLDAVHAIFDDSRPDILEGVAGAVRERGPPDRHVHLVLENDRNAARYLARDGEGCPRLYVAQWNDDLHHALHVLMTGEAFGYYGDYADDPVRHLRRCLTEGFAYQGEPSPYRGGAARGEASADLPPTAFVSFLQNHDQVGNRAFGERITRLGLPAAVRAAAAIVLLAPSPPLLFMGEEWGAEEPFPFFCDFASDLAARVRAGRRREFAHLPEFRDAASRERIPDPNLFETFAGAVLNWADTRVAPHRDWLSLHRRLLDIRRREIAPRLKAIAGRQATSRAVGARGLVVHWRLGDGALLSLVANLGDSPQDGFPGVPASRLLYATDDTVAETLGRGELPPWAVAFWLDERSPAEGS